MLDLRALIFDLDGVITDTAEFHYRSWQRLADEEGIPFTRADNEALRSVSRRESLKRLLKGRPVDEATAQAWMARKQAYFAEFLDKMTPADILPGVLGLLDEARAAGLQTAIASASRNARPVLAKLDLLDRFDAVADGASVVNSKPAPDLLIWAAGRLGISPHQAVVFEDAADGITAALSGGFWAVGVGAAAANAPLRLPNLADTHLTAVIASLESLHANHEGRGTP